MIANTAITLIIIIIIIVTIGKSRSHIYESAEFSHAPLSLSLSVCVCDHACARISTYTILPPSTASLPTSHDLEHSHHHRALLTSLTRTRWQPSRAMASTRASKRQRHHQSLLHFGVHNTAAGGGVGMMNSAATAVVTHKPRQTHVGAAYAAAVHKKRGAAQEEEEEETRDRHHHAQVGSSEEEAEHNAELVRALLQWYDAEHRVLPWRRNPFSKIEKQSAVASTAGVEEDEKERQQFAYMVWVSETMLQQTQVSRVIDYWTRWMARWPTLEACASTATVADVEEMWAGLGYYRRARLLLEGLQRVHGSLGGVIPTDTDALRAIPGIGEYTSAAIASIAFGVPVAAMDANLKRVIARMKCLTTDLDTGSAGADRPQMSQSATADECGRAILISCDDARRRPGCLNQAMMELGARVCQAKSADCGACPVSSLCHAKAMEDAARARWKNKAAVMSGGDGDKKGANADVYSGMSVLDIPTRKEKKERKEEHYNSAIIVLVDPKTKPFIGNGSKVLLTRRGATMPSDADGNGDDENIAPSPTIPSLSPTATGSKGAGPLAGLWEFPSVMVSMTDATANRATAVASISNHLRDRYGVHLTTNNDTSPPASNALRIVSTRTLSDGEVKHVFSHMTWRVKPHLIIVEDVRGARGGTRNGDECPHSAPSSSTQPLTSDAVRWVGYSAFKPTSYTSLVRKLWKLVRS